MAISRSSIGKEIKMGKNKKVSAYKKGKQVDRYNVQKSLPVKVFKKGKYKPGKTGAMEAQNWLLGNVERAYGDEKVRRPVTDTERLHNKLLNLKKKKKVQKKKAGGMILDSKFVASFYD
tara:strand:+ start:550 stop:906 length:357 start_codon:yes stop_codon:yes gene_type:complete